MLDAADLPDDIATLKAMLIAAQLREGRQNERIERLKRLVAALKQAAFGRKSERSDPDQFDLALEALETAIAAIHAEEEADAPRASDPPKRIGNSTGSRWSCTGLIHTSAGLDGRNGQRRWSPTWNHGSPITEPAPLPNSVRARSSRFTSILNCAATTCVA